MRQSSLIARYLAFVVGMLAFTALLAVLERRFGAGAWVGLVCLSASLVLYAVIGLFTRTADIDEYYVAGRRVPALFNGMATAADWVSAASFIGLAGFLVGNGYGGLVYLLGWTGGFCLVGVLLAPYIRKLGGYTIPEFLHLRYPGRGVRGCAAIATVLCSFFYLIAQIQGVGLIASRFVGVDFGIGVFFGLAGILVCSFLGGMRAVTWTQVAQCLVLLFAVLLPTAMIGHQQGLGYAPQITYGKAIERVEALERQLAASPLERAARARLAASGDRSVPAAPASESVASPAARLAPPSMVARDSHLTEVRQDASTHVALRRAAAPRPNPADTAAGTDAHAKRPVARPTGQGGRTTAAVPSFEPPEQGWPVTRTVDFIALLLCLTMGTASLPHVLTRYACASSVSSARGAVAWTIVIVGLFYLTVPALAVMVKVELLTRLPGLALRDLPPWVAQWRQLDTPMITVADVLHDARVHWAGVQVDPDMIVLAAPEIAGLPAYVSGMVAAGALAAALSTADGLLLTIANVLSHDVCFPGRADRVSGHRRVIASKLVLLAVAVAAAWCATRSLGNILFLVSAAFSLAASGLFPVLTLGVLWRRTSRRAALAAMTTGMLVCAYYIVSTSPGFTRVTGFSAPRWFGIDPASAGVFGVAAGFAVALVVSLVDPRAGEDAGTVDRLRAP